MKNFVSTSKAPTDLSTDNMLKETADPSVAPQDDTPTRSENEVEITNNVPRDVESHVVQGEKASESKNASAFKSLGWLDRFLAVWILLAMVVGIILGNFVSGVGEALEKGKFVGVSVPIGMTFSHVPGLGLAHICFQLLACSL